MILTLVFALVAGVIGGAGTDELLRGRDPRSSLVIVAGLVGAAVGLIVRHAIGEDGVLVGTLTALVGGVLLAFVVRVRLSVAIARAGT
jgi:uncharacterized membrane protein YeaQ/YmgE (transglycosylase-associated protein family)